MTLAKIIDTLKMISLKHPNVNSAYEGNIYDILNAPDNRYASVVITQQSHTTDEIYDHYGFVIFYVDRLIDDMEENRVQIQSIGKSMLGNIITAFCNEFEAECENISYQPFTQRFADETAGVYCTITIDTVKDVYCAERYWDESWTAPIVAIKNVDMSITITENGQYTLGYDPTIYTGIDKVDIDVNVDVDSYYNRGYGVGYDQGKVDGVSEQKSKLETISITENGVYSNEDGYNHIEVNVPDLNGSYDEGKEDGIKEQKSKLETINITENGTYTREDGYNSITVEVPDLNGSYDEGYKDGYDEGVEEGVSNAGGVIAETARVLDITENGIYTSRYSNESEFIVGGTSQVTGIYDDGTEFYDTAVLDGALIPLNIVPTVDSRIEFWYLPNMPHMGDGFHRVLYSKKGQISFVFGGGGVDNKNINLKFGNKSVDYTPTKSFGTEWLHIIVDRNGATVNDVEMPFDSQATFSKTEVDLYINGGSDMGLVGRLANGTYGMVKIDGTTFIPKEGGYLNLTTNELCPFVQNNIGILDDGTPITKGGFLDYSVYDTGLKITEDSVIDMWFVRPPKKIDGYVFKSPLFNVRYDTNKYYIMTNGVEQGAYSFNQTEENVINITISKADGFKKISPRDTVSISLSNTVLSSGNHTLLLDSKYNTYGLIKIDGNVIIPTENGFLNTTTNEYLKKVEEYGGEYVYMNPFYEYVNNTEKTPIEIDGNLIKTVNVNVIPKLKLADEKFSFRGAQFTKIPEWADIDGIEDMANFFDSCGKLTEIRWFDASRTTNMNRTFYNCGQLTHFPPLNTIRVTNMREMFNGCGSLVSVAPLDARNVVKQSYGIFGSGNLNNLTDFGGLIGLKASMDGNYGFEKCPNLTYESCINILNGLYDFTGNGLTPTSNEGKLKVHSNFLSTVGDEIAIATNKGWQITA